MFALDPKETTTVIISQVNNGWVVTFSEKGELETFVAVDMGDALRMVKDKWDAVKLK